jgi:hypothetical protein
MPNHYHFILRVVTPHLSHAMQRFGFSYTKSINKRKNRTGNLFQGAFQAKRIDSEEYLLHLSRYVHLNPVRAKLVHSAEAWEFSSYREYVGLRGGTLPQVESVFCEFVRQTTAIQTSTAIKTSEVCYQTSEVWPESVVHEAQTRYAEFVKAYRSSDRTRIEHLLF